MERRLVTGMACALLALAGSYADAAGEAPATPARPVSASVCRVTVRSANDVPLAVASGFLLGQGRFVITDLGALAVPGADRAEVVFEDGASCTARQFALADPAMGLVAIAVDLPAGRGEGLALAKDPPDPASQAPMTTIGWAWGARMESATGQMAAGPTAAELAPRLGCAPPATDAPLFRVTGPGLAAASAAPVVDAGGLVVAMRLDWASRDTVVPVAAPASLLRQALLEASPELKPLAALPEPAWPAARLRVAGEPPSTADAKRLLTELADAMRCDACGGDGEVDAEDVGRFLERGDWPRRRGGRGGRGAMNAPLPPGLRDRTIRCPRCHGEKIVGGREVWDKMAETMAGATRAAWAPGLDGRVRTPVRAAGLDVLTRLAVTERYFREDMARAFDMRTGAVTSPSAVGVVLFGQAGPLVRTSEGPVRVLRLWQSTRRAVFPEEATLRPTGVGAVASKPPAEGAWLMLGGIALGQTRDADGPAVYVLPVGWAASSEPR